MNLNSLKTQLTEYLNEFGDKPLRFWSDGVLLSVDEIVNNEKMGQTCFKLSESASIRTVSSFLSLLHEKAQDGSYLLASIDTHMYELCMVDKTVRDECQINLK